MKKRIEVTVGSNNNITLPLEVVQAFDIREGDKYELSNDSDLLILKPIRENITKLYDAFSIYRGRLMKYGVDIALYVNGTRALGKPIHAVGNPLADIPLEYLADKLYIKHKVGKSPFGDIFVVYDKSDCILGDLEQDTINLVIELFSDTVKNLYK
jgi:bifunctional DNA-binding transcriptional regulator/antitoxin component of YhaV-PrlF toxin-antitoxin module